MTGIFNLTWLDKNGFEMEKKTVEGIEVGETIQDWANRAETNDRIFIDVELEE